MPLQAHRALTDREQQVKRQKHTEQKDGGNRFVFVFFVVFSAWLVNGGGRYRENKMYFHCSNDDLSAPTPFNLVCYFALYALYFQDGAGMSFLFWFRWLGLDFYYLKYDKGGQKSSSRNEEKKYME